MITLKEELEEIFHNLDIIFCYDGYDGYYEMIENLIYDLSQGYSNDILKSEISRTLLDDTLSNINEEDDIDFDKLISDIMSLNNKTHSISMNKETIEQIKKIMSSNLEVICENVHKAYCQYQIDNGKEPYWTGGDYSKLDEKAKEIDRYTVLAVLNTIITF